MNHAAQIAVNNAAKKILPSFVKVADLAGPSNKDRRSLLILAATGKRPKASETGLNNMVAILASLFQIKDTDFSCRAVFNERLNILCRDRNA